MPPGQRGVGVDRRERPGGSENEISCFVWGLISNWPPYWPPASRGCCPADQANRDSTNSAQKQKFEPIKQRKRTVSGTQGRRLHRVAMPPHPAGETEAVSVIYAQNRRTQRPCGGGGTPGIYHLYGHLASQNTPSGLHSPAPHTPTTGEPHPTNLEQTRVQIPTCGRRFVSPQLRPGPGENPRGAQKPPIFVAGTPWLP